MLVYEFLTNIASGSFAGIDLRGIDWHSLLVLALNIFLGVISAISKIVHIILALLK